MTPRARLAVAALVVLALGCASAPKRPTVSAAEAEHRSAQITAADTLRVTKLEEAREGHDAGTVTDAQLELMRAAGKRLERALVVASAELHVYLADGRESASMAQSWLELDAAKVNLMLTWEGVQRGH